jgi:hypothetical protein
MWTRRIPRDDEWEDTAFLSPRIERLPPQQSAIARDARARSNGPWTQARPQKPRALRTDVTDMNSPTNRSESPELPVVSASCRCRRTCARRSIVWVGGDQLEIPSLPEAEQRVLRPSTRVHATLDGRDSSCVTQQLNSTLQGIDGENHVIDWNGARYDRALRRGSTAATGEAGEGADVNGERPQSG